MEPGRQFKQLQMFATPKELGGMLSGDHYLRPMHEVVKGDIRLSTGTRWDSSGNRHDDHDSYMGALKADADKHGGIEVPIRVRHFTNGVTGNLDGEVVDGHHRSALAMQTNRLVPVIHHTDDEYGHDIIKQGGRDTDARNERVERTGR